MTAPKDTTNNKSAEPAQPDKFTWNEGDLQFNNDGEGPTLAEMLRADEAASHSSVTTPPNGSTSPTEAKPATKPAKRLHVHVHKD
jgi:hypothetical protein